MRKIVAGFFLAGWLGSFQVAAQAGATEIEALLSQTKDWTFFWEWADQTVPSATATKGTMEFFRRDGKLFGRTTHMLAGNCEFEVVLREDGFTFEWCGGYRTPRSSVSFDSTDPSFPFKSIATPRKIWFQPN